MYISIITIVINIKNITIKQTLHQKSLISTLELKFTIQFKSFPNEANFKRLFWNNFTSV